MASTTDASFRKTKPAGAEPETGVYEGSARRAIIACAGAALCMAAGGLWLLPSEDAATQLIKLFASVILLLGGLIMFNGLNREDVTPEVQVDTAKRQLRVYEYDAKGRSSLKSCYNIDELKELSLQGHHLRARGADGTLLLEMPLGSDEEESAIRSVMPRTS